jgi:enoyl-CoA hydratase/carnithine racemase
MLHRPHASNCVNLAMALEIKNVVQVIRENEQVRAVILTGAGDSFSVGREQAPRRKGPGGSGRHLQKWIELRQAAKALASVEVPLVAAINGDALNHGLDLVLACDLRIAARGSRLGTTDLLGGVLPWDGGTQRLARIVGRGLGLEMLLTSRLLSAEEAHGVGLVNMVVEPRDLMPVVKKLALAISESAPIAVRYLKQAVCGGLDVSLPEGLRLESDLNIILSGTRDRASGIRSFLDKRKPRFSGE